MKKQLLIALGMLACITLFSQPNLKVFQEWTTNLGTQHFFHKNVTKTDASDNVYVAGATVNASGNYDILVTKYNRHGNLEWTQQIDGDDHFHDFATALYINDTGTVYVTGAITNDTTFSFSDIITLKLDGSDGSVIWQETFDGAGSLYDCGTDIVTSDSGFVYVTGAGYNALAEKDYITLRYNAVGTLIWSNVYDYQGENDAGVKITTSSGGSSVFVLGIGQTSLDTTDYDAVTIRLNKFTGAWVSSAVSSGGSSHVDLVNDFTRDLDGNMYIAGGIEVTSEGHNTYLAKLDSNLVFQWEVTYNGTDDLDDVANGVKVDSTGYVYLVGYSTSSTQRKDWIVIQYDNSGNQQWVESYNDTLDGDDEAMSLELRTDNEIYVTGYDSTAINKFDYYTVKYDHSGAEIWNVRNDGEAHRIDKALNIALDQIGDIIITGESQKLDGSYEYKTVKYVQYNVHNPSDTIIDIPDRKFLFYENKGQLRDYSGQPLDQFEYYTQNSGPDLLFQPDTLSFVFKRIDADSTTQDTLQKIDMDFVKCSADAKLYFEDRATTKLNYYDQYGTVTDVDGYRKLFIHNIFDKIDLFYESNQMGLKYYFVVKPGGDPDDILFHLSGASADSIFGSDSLVIKSFTGNTGFRLHAFQDTTLISASLAKDTNDVYSVTGLSFNPSFPLTVKFTQGKGPERHLGAPDWATPFGGTGEDVGTDVATDASGNSYWSGYTNSDPATFSPAPGFSFPFAGNFDGFICKFGSAYYNGSGTAVAHGDELLWMAYWGGSGEDKANAIDVRGNSTSGHVYVTGYTSSADFNIPNSTIYYNDGYSGAKDAFILDIQYGLLSAITTASATYVGGSADDVANDIKFTDFFNNITIAGITYSAPCTTACVIPNGVGDGFPVCSVFYHNVNSGNGDGFLLELHNDQTINFAEYIGGDEYDEINEVAISVGLETAFVGTTESGNATFDPMPLGGSEYNQTFNGGLKDAFVGKISSLPWLSFFGGSGDDFGNAIAFRPSDDAIIIVGTTESSTPECVACFCNVPSTPGEFPLCPKTSAYFQGSATLGAVFNGGASDGFIAEFDEDCVFVWGTYKGEDAIETLNAVAIGGIDFATEMIAEENILVGGETFSLNLDILESVKDHMKYGYVIPTSGNSDGYLCYFNGANDLVFNQYFMGKGPYNTAINAINIWEEHFFFTGRTNSKDFMRQIGNGDDFAGHVGAYQDAEQWSFNGGIDPGASIPQNDDFFVRIAQMDMPMIPGGVATGVQEEDPEPTPFLVFPNPSIGVYNIKNDGTDLEDISIHVFDILGKCVYMEKKLDLPKGHIKTIDISNAATGMYSILISNNKIHLSAKIIKQ